jgi:hypothetical protein
VSLAAAESPHGTPIEARLLTPISTYHAKPGMEIAAAVATPLCADGASVLPEGTELRGVLKRVHKVGLGLVYESAGLKLEFTRLHLSDGLEYTVAAHLAGIDNARERVDRKGNIHGIRATATLSNRLGERILFAALGHHPASMIPLFALESSMFHFPDPEIEFRRGTEIQLEVEFPEEFGAIAPCPLPEVDASPEEWAALQQVVNALPYWTYSKRPGGSDRAGIRCGRARRPSAPSPKSGASPTHRCAHYCWTDGSRISACKRAWTHSRSATISGSGSATWSWTGKRCGRRLPRAI